MTRIVVLATGGTIASRRSPDGGSRASDTAADLLAALDQSGLGELRGRDGGSIVVDTQDVVVQNSFNFTFADFTRISAAVVGALGREEVDGVVVTHGTDTMEETLAVLGLTHDDPRPVVLTGAQRSPDHADSDGPRNLHAAITTAADPGSRGQGVLLVFGSEIHAALGVRKEHTLRAQPFGHVSGGPLGALIEGRPRYFARAPQRKPFPQPDTRFEAQRVDMVLSYPGADGALIRGAVEAGAHGVVVLGAGAGNPGTELVSAIQEATDRGVLVGLGTRTGSGPVGVIYAGGGAVDAVAVGAVPLGDLPGTQARVLMALLLSMNPPDEAGRMLNVWIGADGG